MVDGYNVDKCLESSCPCRYRESEVLLAIYSRLNIYLSACGLGLTLICWFVCLIFAVGVNRKIMLTAKFSQSML